MNKSRICAAAAVICVLIGIIMQFTDPFTPNVNPGTIGVIGGADGPTSIYVSAGVSYISSGLIALGIIIALTGIVIFIKSRKH